MPTDAAEQTPVDDAQRTSDDVLLNARTLVLGDACESPQSPEVQLKDVGLLSNAHFLEQQPWSPDEPTPSGLRVRPAYTSERPAAPPAVEAAEPVKSPEQVMANEATKVHADEAETMPYIHQGTSQSLESEPSEPCMDPATLLENVCNVDAMLSSMPLVPHYCDQLVLAPSKLPPWGDEKSALNLKTCLESHFDTGLTPENMVQLTPHVVTWMQQLADTPCATLWDASNQNAINSYQTMRTSAGTLHERMSAVTSTCKAVAGAAVKSFQEAHAMYSGKATKEKMLQTKAECLSKWVVSRHQQAQQALEKATQAHLKVRETFEADIFKWVGETYTAYMSDLEGQKVNETDLFDQMDQELEAELNLHTQQPEVVAPMEDMAHDQHVPDTKALEEMVGKALANSTVDPSTQKALLENLGAVFQKTLHGKPVPEDQQAVASKQAQAHDIIQYFFVGMVQNIYVINIIYGRST